MVSSLIVFEEIVKRGSWMEGDDMDGLCPSFLQFGLFHENEVIDLY